MERVSYYKVNKTRNIFLISIGVLFILIGVAGIFAKIFSIHWLNENMGKWNIISYILLGAFYLIIYFSLVKRKRKFIEWDKQSVRFSLPGTNHIELVSINDIDSVKINISDIVIQLKDSTSKIIKLDGLEFADIKLVKAFFTKFE